tara:strand:+ start:74 stop:1183 length:1110 start_codon:yes stop_codon:yes gene_type:complete
MAVTTTTTRHSFNGSGSAFSSGGTPVGQGPFSINFTIIDASHVTVYWTKGASGSGTPTSLSASGNLTINTHYTIQNAGTGTNATITWVESGWTSSSTVTFPTSADLIVITRNVPLTQVTNYQNNATIDAETIEQSFDKLTQTTQQLDDGKDYSFKFASNISGATGFNSTSDTATTLNVDKDSRKGKALIFNATTGDIGVSATSFQALESDITTVAGQSTQIALLGTSDVVADMAQLANSTIIADMALLALTDVIADMALLADSAVIADMALLADNAVITDMALLGTSAVVEDMGFLGTSANVSAMATLGTSANVTNMSTIVTGYDGGTSTSGTNTNLSNINTCASNIGSLNTVATNAESTAIVMGIALG